MQGNLRQLADINRMTGLMNPRLAQSRIADYGD
jgi:hypothetical protein